MTYCVAMRLKAGLVFLSDSRTNAGVDNINTARKMTVFEHPGDRLLVLMTAGNLAISQAVKQLLCEVTDGAQPNLWRATNMSDAVRLVADAVRTVYKRDAEALQEFGVDFNVSLIFGGQIGGEHCRLFQIYAAGNYIEAHSENCYFQIGEFKYGKPIVDRVITPDSSLDEAAKCALISMDSTLKSNLSVGLPLDLLVYERDSLQISRFAQIDDSNRYFAMIRNTWGKRLRQIFSEIDDPSWDAHADSLLEAGGISIADSANSRPVRAPLPAAFGAVEQVRPPGPAAGGAQVALARYQRLADAPNPARAVEPDGSQQH